MVKFLGLDIEFSKKKINDFIENYSRGYVCFINANVVVEANKDPKYLKIINNSSLNMCDGSNVVTVYNILNNEKMSSYPGPDFFIDIIKQKKYKSVFIGSDDKTLQCLKINLVKIDKLLESTLFYSPPFVEYVEDFDYLDITKKMKMYDPDFIWVSLGAPKQEKFMSLLLPHIDKGIMVGVGAAFTFYSGSSDNLRAPIRMRKLNLEWLYRIFQEPKKTLKRLSLELMYMPFLILKETFKK